MARLADLQLKSQRFRAEREWDWRRLESLLRRAERGSASSLSDAELIALPILYRQTLSSLSIARATSLDRNLIDYLEGLSARAYFFVYGARAGLSERLGAFFARTWPAAVRGLWPETLAALAITLAAALVGYGLCASDPAWYRAFFPAGDGRDPAATTKFLKDLLYGAGAKPALTVFAAYLFGHNAQIAIFAFALGFAFCVPTALLLAQNGLTLGALFWLYASRGLGWPLGGWIFIHGTTELFAILLGGAAGIHIGRRIAFPGELPRLAAAASAGRAAAPVLAGVVVMLVVAGLLEGFGRQLVTDDRVRYAIAAAMLVSWLGYFYGPLGRAPRR